MVERFLNSLFCIIFVCLVGGSTAGAASVAVFPFEDLDRGRNGVNLDFTADLAKALRGKGVSVLSEPAVLSFMARNRIRWVGYLDSGNILKAQNELKTDYILCGTLIKKRDFRAAALPRYGLTLFLVRTTDARTVWSNSGGISRTDIQNLLGLAEPGTEEALRNLLVRELLADWPTQLDSQATGLQNQVAYEIENVALGPKYVRPGQMVKCSIRIRQSGLMPPPKVLVKAGNNLYFARENKDGHLFEVSWRGSDILTAMATDKAKMRQRLTRRSDAFFHPSAYYGTGDSRSTKPSSDLFSAAAGNSLRPGIILAKNQAPAIPLGDDDRNLDDAEMYESIWPGSGVDGSYPVSLLLKWPDGSQKVVFLGTYFVDGTPPNLFLEAKGKKLAGVTTFSRQVIIVPGMKNPEPVSRWEIVVQDGDGEEVLSETGHGLLPQHFTWQGQTGSGAPAVDGTYNISLRTWDRAENMAMGSVRVAYSKTPPFIKVEAKKTEEEMVVTFNHEGEIPLAYWRLELLSSSGLLLKTIDSPALPLSIDITKEIPDATGPFGCLIVARDILGNTAKNKIADLNTLIAKRGIGAPKVQETSVTKDWVEDF